MVYPSYICPIVLSIPTGLQLQYIIRYFPYQRILRASESGMGLITRPFERTLTVQVELPVRNWNYCHSRSWENHHQGQPDHSYASLQPNTPGVVHLRRNQNENGKKC
jgi:hypothetical protein